ncbi:DUF2924 domain-containing protein [Sphingomonas sp.]|uniref:DUF2924 domain-containing protein n=1 Tax=Sphingomonas sp. TaxID=28214 RepID=UPI00286DE980|nr:DUF2924 domain-containing protein [Sphingomonas sp.]
MSELDRKLAQLPSMSPAQLRALWRECWRRPAPEIGTDLLRRGIAWKLQSRVHGDLPNGIGRTIDSSAERLRRGEELTGRSPSLRAGSRLVREWRGKTHQVIVLDDGFEHEGRRYSSLTQIASAITGVRWSGPVFFGVKKRAPVRRHRAQ